MSLWVIFDVKGVCNKLSAKKLPHSLSGPCAKLGWATVLLFLAFPPQAKLTFVRDLARAPSQKPLSLLPPTPVWQPSWREVSEEAEHPPGAIAWLSPGPASSPNMTQSKLLEPLWLWSWLQEFQCCASLGPSTLWPCLPSMSCLLVPDPSLFPGIWGTLCLWVSHQKLTKVFNIGPLLNYFLPIFL